MKYLFFAEVGLFHLILFSPGYLFKSIFLNLFSLLKYIFSFFIGIKQFVPALKLIQEYDW